MTTIESKLDTLIHSHSIKISENQVNLQESVDPFPIEPVEFVTNTPILDNINNHSVNDPPNTVIVPWNDVNEVVNSINPVTLVNTANLHNQMIRAATEMGVNALEFLQSDPQIPTFSTHVSTSWIDLASEWETWGLDKWVYIPNQMEFWGKEQNSYFIL
jgi:hypothetical protein